MVNRAIVHGLRDAGMLRRDLSPPLNPGVDWAGVSAMKHNIMAGADAAVCQASVSLEVIQRIKQSCPGTRIILQRDSSHCRAWKELVEGEQERFGIRWPVYGGGLLEREEEEYRLADHITVLSEWVESTFWERGLGEKVVHVGPQTFDQERWTSKPLPPRRPFRVLFAGQTGLRKGLFYLLEAWKRLGLKNAQLLVAGLPEPSCPELAAEVNRRIVETPGAVPLGFVDFDKMASLYADCHALCIPSIEEGATMTALEAMAVGRPVVATPSAGADHLEDGRNGFVVEPRSWEGIAEAISTLYGSPGFLERMSDEARESVRNLGVQRFGERYSATLRNILTLPGERCEDSSHLRLPTASG